MAPHPTSLNSHRRLLLTGTAAALASAGLGSWRLAHAQAAAPKPLPAYASWKDPGSMIVHSSNTIEMKRSAVGTGTITPVNQLYVRNNLPPPAADIVSNRDAWTVAVEGVRKPRSFTVGELKKMPSETVTMVLQCSGNGRGMFPSKPSGTPWQTGAAGCVMWTGVPVRELVKHLGGAAAGTVYLTGTGGEKLPAGIDPNSVMVERSVPLSAMQDALLAWELNGQPIELAHGGPLRLIVPGYSGVNNIKYVKRVALTKDQSPARIQQHGYRMAPPGKKQDPSEPAVWVMDAKSFITSPLPEEGTLKNGKVTIRGVAFGGMHATAKVDVSLDGGSTWRPARLVGLNLGRYAWRQFEFDATLPAGTFTLASRVTDTKGNVQVENRLENSGGYLNSSWRDHAVKVAVA